MPAHWLPVQVRRVLEHLPDPDGILRCRRRWQVPHGALLSAVAFTAPEATARRGGTFELTARAHGPELASTPMVSGAED